jgi:hypothetical protein
MWMFAIQIAIWSAAFVGIAAIAAFGQSSPVLTGTAAYGDWRSDAPGVRRKITPTDMLPPYTTPSVSNGPTVLARPADAWPKAPPGFVVELVANGLDKTNDCFQPRQFAAVRAVIGASRLKLASSARTLNT